MGEVKHNVSYDIADNNTIIPHLSINKYSKTNSNPKKGKSDRTGKENGDVEYKRNLETKLLKILQKRKLLL